MIEARNKLHFHLVPIIIIGILSLCSIFLRNPGIPKPYEGLYFASKLASINYNDLEIYSIFNIIRSPIYAIMDYFFYSIRVFIVASYTGPFLISFLLYYLLFKFSRNIIVSLWLTVIANPLVFGFFMLIIGEAGLIGYSYPDRLASYPGSLISTPFPFNYRTGWFETKFHVRLFSMACYLISVYLFAQRHYKFMLLPILVMFYVHPNNALSAYTVFFMGIIYLLYKKEISYKYLILFLVIFIIGVAPNLFKLSNISIQGNNVIDGLAWYTNTINEADDYSSLYLLIYRTKLALIYFFFPLLISVLYLFINRDYYLRSNPFKGFNRYLMGFGITRSQGLSEYKQTENTFRTKPNSNLLLLTIIVPLIFLFMVIVEYLSVAFKSESLLRIIIGSEIGSKVVEFSLFPMLFMISVMTKDYFRKHVNKVISISFILIIFIPATGLCFMNDNMRKIQDYITVFKTKGKISNIEWLDLSLPHDNKYNPAFHKARMNVSNKSFDKMYLDKYNLFEIHKIDNTIKNDILEDSRYYSQYNSYGVLKNIIRAIEQNIPKNAGIIVPPYTDQWHDCLLYNPIFFQESITLTFVFVSPEFATVLLKRMKMLLGKTYNELPSQTSGLMYSKIRELYLEVGEDRLMQIKKEYPIYNYFVTEPIHKLAFPVIYQNRHYVIYEIKNNWNVEDLL